MWRRLCNLWKLSNFEPDMIGGGKPEGTEIVKGLIKPPKMAEIIRKKVDPIKEIVES